jgi:hypothetical protein
LKSYRQKENDRLNFFPFLDLNIFIPLVPMCSWE